MSYLALYREWRPQTFADLVGQEHVTQTLQNALKSGRVAHSYLFTGPRGTGKTSAAKILAKAVNCTDKTAAEPCNVCPACQGITLGKVMDVIEIDAASNRGVDEIRDLREQVRYTPSEVANKVYIVDEVHMLTTEAFNALLKTLEEPPPHVIFILATTEPHKLPATIISRCQRFDFRRIQTNAIVKRLQEIVASRDEQAEEAALWMIAGAAEGGLRDALSILDQALSFAEGPLTVLQIEDMLGAVGSAALGNMIAAVRSGDVRQALVLYSEQLALGKEVGQLLQGLIAYARDVLMALVVPDSDELKERLNYDSVFAGLTQMLTQLDCIRLMDGLTKAIYDLRGVVQGRLVGEIALIQLCTAAIGGSDRAEAAESVQSGASETESRVAGTSLSTSQHQRTPIPAKADAQVPTQRSVGGPEASRQQPRPGALPSLEEVVAKMDSTKTEQLVAEWPRIAAEVKKRSVSLQAWLAGGEPVAMCDYSVVMAFKNQIHRETVLKPNNKEMIEDVFAQMIGQQVTLHAVSMSDWEAAQKQRMEPDGEVHQAKGDTLVDELISLFGADKVNLTD